MPHPLRDPHYRVIKRADFDAYYDLVDNLKTEEELFEYIENVLHGSVQGTTIIRTVSELSLSKNPPIKFAMARQVAVKVAHARVVYADGTVGYENRNVNTTANVVVSVVDEIDVLFLLRDFRLQFPLLFELQFVPDYKKSAS